MGEVIKFNDPNDLVGKVLKEATELGLRSVIIIGETEDGYEFQVTSSNDCMQVNWMIDRAKMEFMQMAVGESDE